MTTRNIIDFAADGNAAEMRSALYADIHDRVTNHLNSYKQEIAKTLISPQEEEQVDGEQEVSQEE